MLPDTKTQQGQLSTTCSGDRKTIGTDLLSAEKRKGKKYQWDECPQHEVLWRHCNGKQSQSRWYQSATTTTRITYIRAPIVLYQTTQLLPQTLNGKIQTHCNTGNGLNLLLQTMGKTHQMSRTLRTWPADTKVINEEDHIRKRVHRIAQWTATWCICQSQLYLMNFVFLILHKNDE